MDVEAFLGGGRLERIATRLALPETAYAGVIEAFRPSFRSTDTGAAHARGAVFPPLRFFYARVMIRTVS